MFIFLENPETCIARVKERVRKDGHDVPESDIVRRFCRSKENFWNIYRNESDFWYLFYNSGMGFQDVLIGENIHYAVSDEELFNLFLKDIVR